MPQSRERKRVYMQRYMEARRGTNMPEGLTIDPVSPLRHESVSPSGTKPVSPSRKRVSPSGTKPALLVSPPVNATKVSYHLPRDVQRGESRRQTVDPWLDRAAIEAHLHWLGETIQRLETQQAVYQGETRNLLEQLATVVPAFTTGLGWPYPGGVRHADELRRGHRGPGIPSSHSLT